MAFVRVLESAINKGLVTLPHQHGKFVFNPGVEITGPTADEQARNLARAKPHIFEVTDKLYWDGDCKAVEIFRNQKQPGVTFYTLKSDPIAVKRKELQEMIEEEARRAKEREAGEEKMYKAAEERRAVEKRLESELEQAGDVAAHIDAAVRGKGLRKKAKKESEEL